MYTISCPFELYLSKSVNSYVHVFVFPSFESLELISCSLSVFVPFFNNNLILVGLLLALSLLSSHTFVTTTFVFSSGTLNVFVIVTSLLFSLVLSTFPTTPV